MAAPLDSFLELVSHILHRPLGHRAPDKQHTKQHTAKMQRNFHGVIISFATGLARMSERIPLKILLAAYAEGVFPMADEAGAIRWFSPDPRGVLPLEAFHVSKNLRRTRRQHAWEIRVDTCFEQIMRCCSEGRDTWINGTIMESYAALHRVGAAHSLEVFLEDRLVGGLYGVRLGGVFFGESMFHRVTDASKIALWALVELLRGEGFQLLDIQWTTPHLKRFGAIEIPRSEYLKRLQSSLRSRTAWPAPGIWRPWFNHWNP